MTAPTCCGPFAGSHYPGRPNLFCDCACHGRVAAAAGPGALPATDDPKRLVDLAVEAAKDICQTGSPTERAAALHVLRAVLSPEGTDAAELVRKNPATP